MNVFTLKFDNETLEDKYTTYVNQIQTKRILEYLQFIILALIISLVFYSSSKQIPQLLYILAFLVVVILYYYHGRKLKIEHQIYVYHGMMLFIPYCSISMLFVQDMTPLIASNVLICLVMFQLLYQATTNFIHDFVAFTNTIIVIYIYNYLYFGLTIFSFVWFPLYLAHLKLKYNSMKNMKLLFKESQVNQSIYKLIIETSQHQFFCCELDQETLTYQLKLTNILNFDLNQFLSTAMISTYENLKKYLYKKVQYTRATQSIKEDITIWTPNNKKQKIQLYVQQYPRLKYYIKFFDNSDQKQESIQYQQKIYKYFYGLILNKLQKQSISQRNMQRLIQNFTLKVYSNDICEQPIKYIQKRNIDLIQSLNSLCYNMKALYQPKLLSYKVHVNKILETYLHNLIHMIKINNNNMIISITQHQSYTQIIFKYVNAIKVELLDENLKQHQRIHKISKVLSGTPTVISNNEIIAYIDTFSDIPFN